MKRLLLVSLLLLAACSDPDTARRVLTAAGYTNINLTGYSAFSCAESDTYATGFTATGPTGVTVEGVVCSAWLKGATIRLF